MSDHSRRSHSPVHSLLVVILSGLALVACSDDDDDNIEERGMNSSVTEALIDTQVFAAEGGTFSSDQGDIRIVIAPDSLEEDATLSVERVSDAEMPTHTLSSAGDAYRIRLSSTPVEPLQLELTIATPPNHPQLAESARLTETGWVRSPSNFYRASDSTVISLVPGDGVYQAVFRTLQSESGDGVARGLEVFLDETFGNEAFFGDAIGLHELLNELTPMQAVAAGVQIDVSRVPETIVGVLTGNDFEAKQMALASSTTTRALLKADAVVGVKAQFDDPDSDRATSAGITCAVCHAIVEPTDFEIVQGQMSALPVGALKADGTPNTRIDLGAVLADTPFAQAAGEDTVAFLRAFGPGRFDARALPDNPLEDNLLNPTSIPPMWNFVDLAEQGYSYNWDGLFGSSEDPDNALASRAELVYDLVMHANGAFGTPSSSVPAELTREPPAALLASFMAAEDNDPGNLVDQQALLDVQDWQNSLISPEPADFDEALAEQGFRLFNGRAQCVDCHVTAEFTGPTRRADIVLEPPLGALADGIKTPGLRGIATVAPYFHDDSAATLDDVLDVYSGRIVNELTAAEKAAVVEYLKSL